MSGTDVSKEEYTFNNALKEPKIKHFKANPVIVIEGLFIYHFPPAYESYILPSRDTCDIIINNINGMDSAIQLMSSHIKKLINV